MCVYILTLVKSRLESVSTSSRSSRLKPPTSPDRAVRACSVRADVSLWSDSSTFLMQTSNVMYIVQSQSKFRPAGLLCVCVCVNACAIPPRKIRGESENMWVERTATSTKLSYTHTCAHTLHTHKFYLRPSALTDRPFDQPIRTLLLYDLSDINVGFVSTISTHPPYTHRIHQFYLPPPASYPCNYSNDQPIDRTPLVCVV